MTLNYLVGPLSAEEAWRCWQGPRQRGLCRAFNNRNNLDLTITPADRWPDVLGRLPPGWVPDLVVLDLAFGPVPPCLWQAPVPLVALARGWDMRWHAYRRLLPHCDAVLADAPGALLLRRAGIEHVRAANLCGLGPSFLGLPPDGAERDIDVLFAGTFFHQSRWRRQPWLGWLAARGRRWRVAFRQGVRAGEYLDLLRRAKVVFNLADHSECNRRAFEAAAAGALLFQEAGNIELPDYLTPGSEYVAWNERDLEDLLARYLGGEDQRRAIAHAGHRRVQGYAFDALWQQALGRLEEDWPALQERCRRRVEQGRGPDLPARVWAAVCGEPGGDPDLAADLAAAVSREPSAGLHHGLGLARFLEAEAGGRPFRQEEARPLPQTAWGSARDFQRALAADPYHAVAAASLVEVLATDPKRVEVTVTGARQVLALLDSARGASPDSLDAAPLAGDLVLLHAEWERAAWENAGCPQAEAEAKRRLLRWRMHAVLGRLRPTEAEHYERAALQRPDLPAVQGDRASALLRAGRIAEAIPCLGRALAASPFRIATARALFEALSHAGRHEEAARLAEDRRLLAEAAPQFVLVEPWFARSGDARLPAAVEPIADGRAATRPLQPEAEPAEGPPAVVWEGAQAGLHSLALVNREICRRLVARGLDVSLLPREFPREAGVAECPLSPELAARLNRPTNRPADVHVRHAWPPDFRPPPAGHWVMIQPWEFGSLPRAWVGPLSTLVDEVWAYSRAVRECYVQSGVPAERVHVVPLGVDTELFAPGAQPYPLRTRKRFKFLFVGGTIFRKGFDLLLEAYGQAFSSQDDVCLVVKAMGAKTFYQGQSGTELLTRFRERPGVPEVEYLDGDLSPQEMAGLYAACDCLAHPYRGEGFALPVAEAMACGLPVVVTGAGAALDYCDGQRTYLVPARVARFPERRIGEWETVDYPSLAEPEGAALVEILRHVVTHPEEAKAKGRAACAFVRAHLTWDHSCAAACRRIEELRGKPARRRSGTNGSPAPMVAVAPVSPPAPGRRMRVSLCLIVKNEEHNLRPCLESAADLVDEVVVVDTGSTDRTKEIAYFFGARVFDFPWCDSFAAARNEAINHASGEWIFWMDADDRLDEANRVKLHALFAGLGDENVAYSMKCLCLPDPVSRAATTVDHVRMFRNHPQVRWRYRVHEQILMAVRESGGAVRFADVVIEHTGYQDRALRRRKLDRDLRLLHMENAEHPDDPFTLFNLGQVSQELGQHAEAIPLLRRSLARSGPRDSIVRKLYALLVGCHQALGQRAEAAAACAEGLRVCPNDTELLFHDSNLRKERGDLAGSDASLLRLIHEQPGAHFASVDAGLRGHKARHNLAVLYLRQGKVGEAEAQWKAAAAQRPDFLQAWLGLGECCLRQGNLDGAESIARRMEEQPGGRLEATLLRARGMMARRDFAGARTVLEGACVASPQAVGPRVVLSHALLQEGRDLQAAEGVLREVLRLEPGNAEARDNLEKLLRQKAAVADAALAGGPPGSAPDGIGPAGHGNGTAGGGAAPQGEG